MSHSLNNTIYYYSSARSRQTRASILNLSTNGEYLENDKPLLFLPNFQINNEKINMENYLPELNTNLSGISIEPYLKYNSILDSNREIIENSCRSVGEIIVIFQIKNNPKVCLFAEIATCFILKSNEDKIILSVFHLQSDYSSETYNKFYFIHFSEKNIISFDNFFQEMRINPSNNIAEDFITYTKNENDIDLFQIKVDDKFLKLRKKFLERNRFSNILIDPEYFLQPMPSCDFLIFQIDTSLMNYVNEKNIYIEIADFETKDSISQPLLENEVLFLCGHHNSSKVIIHYNSSEYKKTLTKLKLKIPLILIIDDNKNLGIIRISKFNKHGLFTFYGSTSPGSSGSLILNSNGKAIGMSFANYQDIETKGENKENCQEDNFDLLVPENTNNYKKSKNLNLGLSLYHPLLRLYLQNINNIDSLLGDEFFISFYGDEFMEMNIIEKTYENFIENSYDETNLLNKKIKRNSKSCPLKNIEINKNRKKTMIFSGHYKKKFK